MKQLLQNRAPRRWLVAGGGAATAGDGEGGGAVVGNLGFGGGRAPKHQGFGSEALCSLRYQYWAGPIGS